MFSIECHHGARVFQSGEEAVLMRSRSISTGALSGIRCASTWRVPLDSFLYLHAQPSRTTKTHPGLIALVYQIGFG